MKNLILLIVWVSLFLSSFTYATAASFISNGQKIKTHIVELSDSTGLVYIGAAIAPVDVAIYLTQLKNILGEQKFQQFRANQIARDQHGFHVTLINPFEYKKLIKNNKKVTLGESISITLQGLGKVAITSSRAVSGSLKQDNAQSYFVIISSPDGDKFRQHYALKAKDFHVTLGFNPHDIYTLSKGIERLVK
jgi:hypothetical protein